MVKYFCVWGWCPEMCIKHQFSNIIRWTMNRNFLIWFHGFVVQWSTNATGKCFHNVQYIGIFEDYFPHHLLCAYEISWTCILVWLPLVGWLLFVLSRRTGHVLFISFCDAKLKTRLSGMNRHSFRYSTGLLTAVKAGIYQNDLSRKISHRYFFFLPPMCVYIWISYIWESLSEN